MTRLKRAQKGLSWRVFFLILVILIVLIMIALRFLGNDEKVASQTSRFSHVHGLGFDASGKTLTAAVHEGLMVYVDGKWKNGIGEPHDYMGFSPTNEGFFSSGHPAAGSALPNPLGIVRSADDGGSVNSVAFAGEIDFHVMGAGYNSHVLYVYQPETTKTLGRGLHFSQDLGERWTAARHDGLSGVVISLAVHPDNPEIVAIGTSTGAYFSRDFGQTFTPVTTDAQVTALSFGPSGELYVASYHDEYAQIRKAGADTMTLDPIQIPTLLPGDAVSSITVSLTEDQHLAFATFQSQVYIRNDGEKEWLRVTE